MQKSKTIRSNRGVVPLILAIWVGAVFVGGIATEYYSTRGARAAISEVDRADRVRKKAEKREAKRLQRLADLQAREDLERKHARILNGERP